MGDRSSLGAWGHYGLGSENRNLPASSCSSPARRAGPPPWCRPASSPRAIRAPSSRRKASPTLALPADTTAEQRRAQLDLLGALKRRHLERHAGNSEREARLRSYELAFRMQTAAGEAFDLARETKEVHALYGLGRKETAEVGASCLLARRLVERGVRFVQVRVGGWEGHNDLVKNHDPAALKSDRPVAALLTDLKRRGLLGQTLVVWGGEFGRTPAAENPGPAPGRDHSPSGYSMWLAGGGVKGGQVVGATDAVGYAAVERPIHPNDLHATILHALGIDQSNLSYRHNNRRELVAVNGGAAVREAFS